MGEKLRKIPWLQLSYPAAIVLAGYFYTLHLNAQIDTKLLHYETKQDFNTWRGHHKEWGDEVIKRIDDKLEYLSKQNEENNKLLKQLLRRP